MHGLRVAELIVPKFPLTTPHDEWDTLTLLAATIFLEAEGEPVEGKNAVSWVIRNRADQWRLALPAVVLQPMQFSCWNSDYAPRATARLAAAGGDEAEQSWRAATGALWRLAPNPIQDAMFYLNVTVTKQYRKKHDLPDWAADPRDPMKLNQAKLVGQIGRHHFLRG